MTVNHAGHRGSPRLSAAAAIADTADDLCHPRTALLAKTASTLDHAEERPRGDVVANLGHRP